MPGGGCPVGGSVPPYVLELPNPMNRFKDDS